MDQSQTYQLIAATLAQGMVQKIGNLTPAQVISDVYTPILQELIRQNPGKIADDAQAKRGGFNG